MSWWSTETETEFDIDPLEVSDGPKLAAVFDFMYGLADVLRKEVLLTPENEWESAIFRCHPNADWIEYRPFFNGATTSLLFSKD